MKYVVLGGGIAGVCCAEELCKLCPDDPVTLISADTTLKGVDNVVKYSDNLEQFEIVQRDLSSLPYPNLTVVQGFSSQLSIEQKQVVLADGKIIPYDKLCVCTGATPKAVADSPHVLVLRDQDSIEKLAKRLPNIKRAVLVGNGGIALEVAFAFTGVEVIWAVRHGHIGDAFFDLDAAAFLCSQLPNIQPAAATAVPSEDTPAAATPDQQGSSPSTAMTARMQSTANAAGVSPVACAGHIAHQQSSDASTGTLAHLQTPDCGRGDGQSPGLYGPPLVQAREHDTCLRDSSCGNQGVQEVNLDDQEALTQQQHPQVEQPKQKVVQQQHAQDKQPKQHGNSKGQEQQPDTSMHDMQQLPQRAHGRRRNKQTQPTNPCSSSGQSDDVQQAQQCAVSAHQSQPAKEDGRPVDKPAATNCNAAQDNSAGIQIKQGGGHRFGHAAGPQWASLLPRAPTASQITLEYGVEVTSVQPSSGCEEEWPLNVRLSNGKSFGADLVISAIGVRPNVSWLPSAIQRDEEDGGILVDRLMQSSVPDVYAAGDACSITWTDKSPHWFRMRLWTQAKIQGMFAAHAMAGVTHEMAFGFNFELFTHITRFCGRKVVLLGLYNGQGLESELGEDMVTYSRSTEGPNATFIRVLLLRGRMQGAVLIGETELEETFEHLILDGLDLSRYGPDLLAPDVELEMIFD